jgi:hypothetical protein
MERLMDDLVKKRIKDSIVCGRYPDLQDIIDFWNFVEKDEVKLASFKIEESSKPKSIEEIDQKIEICKNVKEHISQTKSFLSNIRFFLPASVAFSLIRASDKLNLALVHAESWHKNLIAERHNLS